MRYLNAILIAAFCLALLLSCRKKDAKTEEGPKVSSADTLVSGTTTGATPPVEIRAPRIKTEITSVGSNSMQIDYTYDNKGRATRMDYSSGYYITVEWSPDKCIRRTFIQGSDTEQSSVTYNLDASGKATSSSTQGSSSSYEYDEDGYLVKLSSSGQGMSVSTTYVISGGNTVSYSSTNGSSTTSEYFTERKNTIGSQNKGLEIDGRQNKNLLKKFVVKQSIMDVSTDYTYEFDAGDRVTKMSHRNSAGETVVSYTYYD